MVEYSKLKITDNNSDNFLRMLSKKDLPFSSKNLRKLHLADLQKTYENLIMNLGKIILKSYRVFWAPALYKFGEIPTSGMLEVMLTNF